MMLFPLAPYALRRIFRRAAVRQPSRRAVHKLSRPVRIFRRAALIPALPALLCCAPPEDAQVAEKMRELFRGNPAGVIERPAQDRRMDGPPNIVLIIADDLGWPYLGFLGDEYAVTPNMDMLAEAGYVFETAHSTSNHCRPTLQSLATGYYPLQYAARAAAYAERRLAADENNPENGSADDARAPAENNGDNSEDDARATAAGNNGENNAGTPLSPAARNLLRRQYETEAIAEFATLPRLLGEAGYASHQSGKWWEQSWRHGGFTEGMTPAWHWRDALAAGDSWFFNYMGGQGMAIGRETMAPVTEFINRHASRPFFLWYGPALPHVPLNPPARHYRLFESRADLSESAKLYYANIAWFDAGVGELLSALHQHRLMGNTLIAYINDNGWDQAPDVEYSGNANLLRNGGPRGKGAFFDTSFRTPVVFHWQDRIEPGRDKTTLVSAVDLMPTLLDFAGVDVPPDLPGISLKPLLINAENGQGEDGAPQRNALFGHLTTHRDGSDFRGQPVAEAEDAMGHALQAYYRRDLRWHFVWLPESGEMALWDLREDPGQLQDVSERYAEMCARFIAEIKAWRDELQ